MDINRGVRQHDLAHQLYPQAGTTTTYWSSSEEEREPSKTARCCNETRPCSASRDQITQLAVLNVRVKMDSDAAKMTSGFITKVENSVQQNLSWPQHAPGQPEPGHISSQRTIVTYWGDYA